MSSTTITVLSILLIAIEVTSTVTISQDGVPGRRSGGGTRHTSAPATLL